MGRTLRRELGLGDAVLLGLGSIVGTGVFVSVGLAGRLAGQWTLVAVVLAGLLAGANGLSSAQLAAAHPVSGGTYEHAHRLDHPLAGFIAGWAFLAAKSASAATAALTFAAYALGAAGVEAAWPRGALALVLVTALTALVSGGMRRSARVNRVLVGVTIGVLVAFVLAVAPAALARPVASTVDVDAAAVARAAALLFVAYTGYGRIATLGEEVVDPRRTIPRAVGATLAVTAVLYLAVGAVSVRAVDPGGLPTANPLEHVASAAAPAWVQAALAVGATAAAVSVLLNLLLGLSRVALAMGRRGDLPSVLGRVDDAGRTPRAATLAVGVVVASITLVGDVALTWSFSALTVLVYYGITNATALALPADRRLAPRWVSVVGLVGCAGLAGAIGPVVWAAGVALVALCAAWWTVLRLRRRTA